MTDTMNTIAESNSTEGMPRREFIRKSLIASGGVFAGMALGEKMALPELYGTSSSDSSSGGSSDGGDWSSGWCGRWAWCH